MSAATMVPDEQLRIARALLAEAGYPDADVEWYSSEDEDARRSGPVIYGYDVPNQVGWKMFTLHPARRHHVPCLRHYEAGEAHLCTAAGQALADCGAS